MDLPSPPKVHSNVNLPSSSKVHFNVNLPFPLLKCIPLEIHSNMDPPSPMLQHTPPEAHSNVDLSSFSQSLKYEFNGKIKSQSRQIHPNMSLSFIPSFSNPLSSSSTNVLHTVSIAELLKQYPNHHFIDTITMIVASGVRLGFEGSHLGQTCHLNHASAFEISKDHIKEVDSLPINYFCSSISLALKLSDGKQTRWRTIFDLSSPSGYSINDGIPKEYDSLVYEMLKSAI